MERELCQKCGSRLEDSRRKTFCASCTMRPAKQIRYGSEICIPHRGDFDEDETPVLDGLPFLPGLRSCGHTDCVNVNHIYGYERE